MRGAGPREDLVPVAGDGEDAGRGVARDLKSERERRVRDAEEILARHRYRAGHAAIHEVRRLLGVRGAVHREGEHEEPHEAGHDRASGRSGHGIAYSGTSLADRL